MYVVFLSKNTVLFLTITCTCSFYNSSSQVCSLTDSMFHMKSYLLTLVFQSFVRKVNHKEQTRKIMNSDWPMKADFANSQPITELLSCTVCFAECGFHLLFVPNFCVSHCLNLTASDLHCDDWVAQLCYWKYWYTLSINSLYSLRSNGP